MPTVATLNVDLLADVNDLAQGMRTATTEVKQFKAEAADKALFREWITAQKEARRVIESVKTPTERYTEQVARLRRMLELAVIDQQTFSRAVQQAQRSLERSGRGGIEDADQASFREWIAAQRDAGQVIEAVRTPTERYGAEVSRLRRMLQLGAIDQETFTRATRQAAQQMQHMGRGGAGAGFEKMNRTLDLLAGGGALAAMMALVRSVERGATEVAKMAEEFRAGNASAGELGQTMLSAVPVFGEGYRAGLAIREAWMGIAASVAEAVGASEEWVRFWESDEARAKRQLEESKQANALAREWNSIRQKAAVAGLSGPAAERAAITAEFERELERIKGLGFEGMGPAQRGMLADMRAAAETLRDAKLGELAERARAPITQLITSLHEQARAMQMTADEAAFLKAVQTGATNEELRQIEALQGQIAAYREAQQAAADYRAEQERMGQAVQSLVAGLEDQVRTFGMSAKELALYRLQQNQATPDLVEYTAALHDQLAALQERNALEQEAARIYDATRTPLERYMGELEKLGRMLEEGLIDQDTAGRRLRELQAGLAGGDRTALAGVAERGTAEAYSLIVRATQGATDGDKKILRDQLAEAVRGNRILEELLRRAEGGVVASFN